MAAAQELFGFFTQFSTDFSNFHAFPAILFSRKKGLSINSLSERKKFNKLAGMQEVAAQTGLHTRSSSDSDKNPLPSNA